jgi:hypothetical protein
MDEKTYAQLARYIESFVEGAFDSEIKSAVRTRAVIAGIVMAVPLWGIETIVYFFCLWGTYKKICDIGHVPFRENFIKNVLSGIITNVLVTLVLGLLMDLIPVVGWVASFALGYISLYLSAMGYVKILKRFHGNKLKTDLNIQRGMSYLQNNPSPTDSTFDKTVNQISRFGNAYQSRQLYDGEQEWD